MTNPAVIESPDVEVVPLTNSEWREATERGLRRLGLTYDQLAAEAESRDFSSNEARKLWMAIGGRRP